MPDPFISCKQALASKSYYEKFLVTEIEHGELCQLGKYANLLVRLNRVMTDELNSAFKAHVFPYRLYFQYFHQKMR